MNNGRLLKVELRECGLRLCSCVFAGLHRGIQRISLSRTVLSADGLSARHTIPRLRILIRTCMVFLRSISAGWHRLAYLLAKRKELWKRPAGYPGPFVTWLVWQSGEHVFPVVRLPGKFGCDRVVSVYGGECIGLSPIH